MTNIEDGQRKDGVLYVASGTKYVRAAIASARSLRRVCPDLPIHFFVDDPELVFSSQSAPLSSLTSVEKLENPHPRSKVECLERTPFERTLFLDSDTFVLSDIRDGFALLDKFDIAMTHAPGRAKPRTPYWRVQLPTAFFQLNSGVIFYRRSAEVFQLFSDWQRGYQTAGFFRDQVVLRELLWLSELKVYVLPLEFNIRKKKYLHLWAANEARPRILHHEGMFGRVTLRRRGAKLLEFLKGRWLYSPEALKYKMLKGRSHPDL